MGALTGPVWRSASRLALGFACLAAVELGYRAHTHRPVLALEDWRTARLENLTFGDNGRFDPVLGWALHEHDASEGYSTLDLGIRRNDDETEIRTGGILAVGDVFTHGGMEVADDETWPAQLERIVGVPVLNAGVPGYAIDQTVLRAERLLPQVRPVTVVVGLVEDAIATAGFASFGLSKPFFTLEEGELVYHPPVPPAAADAATGWPARARNVLGYSAVLDSVLTLLAPAYWRGTAGEDVMQSVNNDPVDVTCALLRRLKARADGQGARVLLFMQYAGRAVIGRTEPRSEMQEVAACAGSAGLEVVDQLPDLRAAAANADALKRLYLHDNDNEQMSEEGNRLAAVLLARALGK